MPSLLHEMFVEMFTQRPAFAAELLTGPLATQVPDFERADLSSADLGDIKPTERRADSVVTLTRDGKPVLAVVIEVQLRADRHKQRTWPAYVATLYARLGCPVELLVICPSHGVAQACATPIQVSRRFVLTPLVLGPHEVPLITDPQVARQSPELAVLSALAHGDGADATTVLGAMRAGLQTLDADHAGLYADIVLTALPAAARDYLEDLMDLKTRQPTSETFRRHLREGRAEGEATALLTVLEVRGIEVPDDVRERITSCTDLDQLDSWVRRAVTVDKVQDLFD